MTAVVESETKHCSSLGHIGDRDLPRSEFYSDGGGTCKTCKRRNQRVTYQERIGSLHARVALLEERLARAGIPT